MQFFSLFISFISARQVLLASKESFVFSELVEKGAIFKFIYNCRTPIKVSVDDSEGKSIFSSNDQTAKIYTKAMETGEMRITVTNPASYSAIFSYKCPDPSKELQGYLGYVKDTDLVADLTRVLDDLVAGQEAHVARVKEHYAMVSRSRSWVKWILCFEFLVTFGIVYILHKDFVAMFETKQAL